MKAGFSAVGASPLRLGADKPYTRTVGVVVDLPRRRKECIDVGGSEKVGRAVRSVEHADIPIVGEFGDGTGGMWLGFREIPNMQSVARAKHAASMAAELAEDEGGTRAKVFRHVEASADCDIGA